jgi:hypothetical protein
MDRLTVPTWTAHPAQAVRDCCGLVSALAERMTDNRLLHGRLDALRWAVLGGPTPVTNRVTGIPTRDQVEDEWFTAGDLSSAAALDQRTEGVFEALGWLLGRGADPGVTLPVRPADGSTPTGRDAALTRIAAAGLDSFTEDTLACLHAAG